MWRSLTVLLKNPLLSPTWRAAHKSEYFAKKRVTAFTTSPFTGHLSGRAAVIFATCSSAARSLARPALLRFRWSGWRRSR